MTELINKLAGDHLAKHQADYWLQQEASVDGMLGGYGAISEVDIQGSRQLLRELTEMYDVERTRALDVGAGIGRITEHLLIPAGFKAVDLLDIDQRFLDTARDRLSSTGQLGDCFCSGFTQFDFAGGSRRWDLIWMQWCAIYLNNDAFVDFFKRAAQALTPTGILVLKENTLSKSTADEFDDDDGSVTRGHQTLRRLFKKAGLELLRCKRQAGFPPELYPVYFYVLRPL
ncbi:uncharacterized protein MONBRDRAFT_21077 [Monosiga brevicollis MX1]|uniref:Alpha N-terminal protein methyltransferase 1 n=1 Tax=Monosiga brevicollis TaxID=81824 RepID=A9UQI2_MONBE|nr:uncharacterized protein MONBRDRAFT_21077 [Monosiga brevicollis MX1]EDQ93049.1 predicted protein [Monosiga brevicollis MX1]|eukprot:XP_001742811.1 hypothetical protein [Monosiga brevicollis MX1]